MNRLFFIVLSVLSVMIYYSCEGGSNSKDSPAQETSAISHNGEGDGEKIKRYGVPSGIIEYETSTEGNIMGVKIGGKGKKKLIFKDYGALEVVEEEKSENNMGQKSNIHTLTKFDNGMTYAVDFEAKTIIKQDQSGMFKMLAKDNDDLLEVGEALMKSMGGKKIGKENIKSYDCDVWEVMGQKIWMYKGVPLQLEGDVMGIKTMEKATKIELDVPVPASAFELPDFPVQEMPGMQMPGMSDEEKAAVKKMKNMSFAEFKEMASHDENYSGLNEEELRQTYEMLKKMAEIMPQN